MPTGSIVRALRKRAGFSRQDALSEALGEILPPGITHNHYTIQQIESSNLPRWKINDMLLLGICQVTGGDPELFGITPGKSEFLDRAAAMLEKAGWLEKRSG